jgi:hypothetical protein
VGGVGGVPASCELLSAAHGELVGAAAGAHYQRLGVGGPQAAGAGDAQGLGRVSGGGL